MSVPVTKMQKVRETKTSTCEGEKTLICSLKWGTFRLQRCNLEFYNFSTFIKFFFALTIQSSTGSEHSFELMQHF